MAVTIAQIAQERLRAPSGLKLKPYGDPPLGADYRVAPTEGLIGIDPGPVYSGWVVLMPDLSRRTNIRVEASGVSPTLDVLLQAARAVERSKHVRVVIEHIVPMGMPLGESTVSTAWLEGVLAGVLLRRKSFLPQDLAEVRGWLEASAVSRVEEVSRPHVKLTLAGSARAKDTNLRRVLLDWWAVDGPSEQGYRTEPARGTASHKGPLWGVASHAWSALAVATAWLAGAHATPVAVRLLGSAPVVEKPSRKEKRSRRPRNRS